MLQNGGNNQPFFHTFFFFCQACESYKTDRLLACEIFFEKNVWKFAVDCAEIIDKLRVKSKIGDTLCQKKQPHDVNTAHHSCEMSLADWLLCRTAY